MPLKKQSNATKRRRARLLRLSLREIAIQVIVEAGGRPTEEKIQYLVEREMAELEKERKNIN